MMSGAMSSLSYGPPCEITVNIDKIDGRKNASMKDRNRQVYKAPVFMVSAQIITLMHTCKCRMARMSRAKSQSPSTRARSSSIKAFVLS